MNCLLINPWIYDFAAYDLWIQPVGLLKLSSLLKAKGHNVCLINCLDRFDKALESFKSVYGHNQQYECGHFYKEEILKPEVLSFVQRNYFRYGFPLELFREKLKKIKNYPDVIFVSSMMTYWYLAVFDTIKILKEFFPKAKIVLAGIYPALLPEHAKQSQADYVWTKEGLNIDGLKITNQELNKFKQDRVLLTNKKVHILQTSFGCPFNCTYCGAKKIISNFFQREAMDVLEEMEHSVRHTATKHFVFYDDALFVNSEKHIKVILDEWIKKELPTYFHSPNGLHVRLIDRELAQLMFKAGFKTIRLSFESSEEKLQAKSGKVNNDEFAKAIEFLKEAGFRASDIEAYVMMGFPGQSLEQCKKDVLWVNKFGVKISLSDFSPVPGTKDFDDLCEKGILQKDEDPLLHNNSIFIYRLGFEEEKIKKIRKIVSMLNYGAELGVIAGDI